MGVIRAAFDFKKTCFSHAFQNGFRLVEILCYACSYQLSEILPQNGLEGIFWGVFHNEVAAEGKKRKVAREQAIP